MTDSNVMVERFHPEVRFGGFTDIDGTVRFYVRVQELLSPDAVAIDVGCGRGTQADDPLRVRRDLRILRGKCRRVIGLDVDPAASENPYVDEFRLIEENGDWPVESGSVDLVLADFVLEHVADPVRFVAQSASALRPGGMFCLRTINAWSYVGLASRMTPERLHHRLLRRVQPKRSSADVFPTVYRCNNVPQLRRLLAANGFDAVVYGADAEPAYLGVTGLTYRIGILYGQLAPSWLSVGIFAWARRR